MNAEDSRMREYASLFFGMMLTIALVISNTVVSILVLLYGWGIEPRSWKIIIIGVVWSWTSMVALALIKSTVDRIAR